MYFGTFSKTLLPSLGIGYLAVPRRYVEPIARVIDSIARPPSLSIQVTIARLIASGAFESHVRAMRTLYRRRQDALARLIRPALVGQLEIEVLNAGLHLIGWLPEGSDDRGAAESARRHGLLPRPMSDFLSRAALVRR